MDPVSLTLGLLPLIAGTVKGAKKTRTKLHALVNYADEVKRVHMRFMIQESRVRTQSALLICHARAVPLNVNIETELLEQAAADLPTTLSLGDEKIKRYLGDSYNTCVELFCDISSKQTAILKMLERFESDTTSSHSLNRDRRDLQLSLSAEAPCKPLVLAKASNQPSLAFPPYERITRATKDLHLALSSAFMGTPSSATIAHARKDIAHQAKLFIDASKTNDESVEIWDAESGGSDQDQPQRKKTRPSVRKSVRTECPVLSTGVNAMIQSQPSSTRQLQAHAFELCTCLHRGCCSGGKAKHQGKGRAGAIPGSLHTLSTPAYTHSFLPTHGADYCRPSNLAKDFMSLREAFDYDPEPNFSKTDQLKLARNIATALLKFHGTPWLGDFWGVRDLSLVSVASGGIGSSLGQSMRTLHVGLDAAQALAPRRLPPRESSAASLGRQTLLARRPKDAPAQDCPQLLDAGTIRGSMQLHRIDNLPLYYLGVVLLQIDRWEPVNEDDLSRVYQLARKKPRLGERYAYIVQKCLKCCFAQAREADYDLSNLGLQTGVYQEVTPQSMSYAFDYLFGDQHSLLSLVIRAVNPVQCLLHGRVLMQDEPRRRSKRCIRGPMSSS
ncbi:hypothetical protein MCOR02_001189 [Pyricularia oryzae]|nr:hypothetical protein MCOR02_001189 [Pyricularia oryzae]KAI6266157.1 hypothetical protein MCOR26_010358 [Pyricularia oryzae]KAI6409265.1 hypothetical protein MCOR23_000952 [Pyricularia oryzae]KAI6416768.1 hypothetical protein MCOR20_000720 [Pyricularia oryzae]KAI6577600.1 hypothetical protein MCOR09_000357 [Pyricularia oryzae]